MRCVRKYQRLVLHSLERYETVAVPIEAGMVEAGRRHRRRRTRQLRPLMLIRSFVSSFSKNFASAITMREITMRLGQQMIFIGFTANGDRSISHWIFLEADARVSTGTAIESAGVKLTSGERFSNGFTVTKSLMFCFSSGDRLKTSPFVAPPFQSAPEPESCGPCLPAGGPVVLRLARHGPERTRRRDRSGQRRDQK